MDLGRFGERPTIHGVTMAMLIQADHRPGLAAEPGGRVGAKLGAKDGPGEHGMIGQLRAGGRGVKEVYRPVDSDNFAFRWLRFHWVDELEGREVGND